MDGGAGGEGVTRAAMTRAGRSWHRPLVQTAPGQPGGDPENHPDITEEQTVAENFQEAKDGAKQNQINQPFMDHRNLTLGVVVEAV